MQRVLPFVLIGALVAASVACSPAADKQRQEEAINRGEAVPGAPVAVPADEFASGCASSGGVYDAATQHCTVTAAMCANLGEWRDGIGCVMTSMDATACTGMSGLKMVGDACVITHATREFLNAI
jgi:hypothetical protein